MNEVIRANLLVKGILFKPMGHKFIVESNNESFTFYPLIFVFQHKGTKMPTQKMTIVCYIHALF